MPAMDMRAAMRTDARFQGPWRKVVALAVGALMALSAIRALPTAAAAAHLVTSALRRGAALAALRNWPRLQTPYFTVYYQTGEAAQARVVAQVADRQFPPIARDFGLALTGPRRPLVVSSRGQMLAEAGGEVSVPPLGLYAFGVIWLLEPSAFLSPGPGLAARYAARGPVAHELTHLGNDLDSAGRDPVWLDEGIAQYEDWRLTGYLWRGPGSAFGPGDYTWRQIAGDFYGLPDQPLAFHEAFAAAALLCGHGPGDCVRILRDIGHGMSVVTAVRRVDGPGVAQQLVSGALWSRGAQPPSDPSRAPAP